MYRILCAILNTGNIEFAAITSQHQTDKSEVPNPEPLENGEASVQLSTFLVSPNWNQRIVIEKSKSSICWFSQRI